MDMVLKALSVFSGWNLVIREYGNGVVLCLCFILATVIGSFLMRTYSAVGVFSVWRKTDGAQTACILLWLLMAEGLRSLCAFIPLNALNDGLQLSETATNIDSLGFTIAVLALALVLIRAVFLFQERDRIGLTLTVAVITIASVVWWRDLMQWLATTL